MWRPAVVTIAPTDSAVSLADACAQVRVDDDDAANSAKLGDILMAAQSHVEAYTGTALTGRTVRVRCESFADLAYLPFGPVRSIGSIAYVDSSGVPQTLDAGQYELRADGLEAAIAPALNVTWPSLAAGSLITVMAVIGYVDIPDVVRSAVLLIIGELFEKRENVAAVNWSMVDLLLVNHRI